METAVTVAGAGPTGLVLGCALAAQGVDVRLVDRAEAPATTSRANILHARGVEVLDRVGALGDLPDRALSPIGITMYSRGRELATMRFSPDPRDASRALFVSQALVEERLRERFTALGGTIERGRAVAGARQDEHGVTVEFDGGGSARTGWLVGCDGARSTVRSASGIGFPGVAVIERFLLADVDADWDRPRTGSAGWFHPDGMLLAMPMRGDGTERRWRLMADVPDTGERLAPEQIVDRLQEAARERADQRDLRIRRTVWTSVFRIQRRLADTYRSGRILLAGDAAHVHSPIGGQGMTTGMGDAENLAWKLGLVARGLAEPALLDTYTAERRPLAADVLRNTTANTRLLAGATPLLRMLRDRLFVPVLNLPAVRRQATRGASQLWVTYRRGPLGGRGGAPRPGDRVPDRECAGPDGAPARLHGELGPAWALLARQDADTTELAALARGRLGEVAVLRTPEAAAPAMLVRPDGHLAWRGRDAADLGARIDRVLRGGAA